MDDEINYSINYFERKIDDYQKKITECTIEINDCRNKISDLKNSKNSYEYLHTIIDQVNIEPGRLINVQDQIKIIEDIKNNLANSHRILKDKEDGLFMHVDNIRYVFKCENKECPRWFSAKYGHLFKK